MQTNLHVGLAFDDEDVARAYAHRPPYPDPTFEFLSDLPGRHQRALDLGCGPGKITHLLARRFTYVDAIDPSRAMLAVADDGRQTNVSWIHGYAETADLAPEYDLVTAGASIHWMNHALLFTRLVSVLAPDGFIAIIEGDEPHAVPWQAEWEAFMARWLARLGGKYDPAGYREKMLGYRKWMEIAGERNFASDFSQSIEDFIECQHSRATWSRANLGPKLSSRFGAELRALLQPYATDGHISYRTMCEVIWGRPKLNTAM